MLRDRFRAHALITFRLHKARTRTAPIRGPKLHLPTWPPDQPTASCSTTSSSNGYMSLLSFNFGGLTPHGYDELCTWLHTFEVQAQVDVICLQETWRLGSEYLLPGWTWISSGAAPTPSQGVAVLVNHRFAQSQTIRFREIQIGRLLHGSSLFLTAGATDA